MKTKQLQNKRIDLDKITDEALLELRFCELPISLQDSDLGKNLDIFYSELEAKDIPFKPVIYLADEWLCPEGLPAIGIPFYLAHPRLKSLEQKMMLEVEGGTQREFLKLIRHEMGHAISYAYSFQRKRKWRELFGQPSEEFSDAYPYRKYSRGYVHNLDNFYAQSHPDEDFAETFAVWLDPKSNWQERYKNWKAMEKLEYVDSLMKSVNGQRLKINLSDVRDYNIRYLRSKLETFYRKKQKLYAADYPDYFDEDLKKIFRSEPENSKSKKAVFFLREQRKIILQTVASFSGGRKYNVDQILKRFVLRCRQLSLWTPANEELAMASIISCVTALVKNYQMTGKFKEKH